MARSTSNRRRVRGLVAVLLAAFAGVATTNAEASRVCINFDTVFIAARGDAWDDSGSAVDIGALSTPPPALLEVSEPRPRRLSLDFGRRHLVRVSLVEE